MVKTDMKQRWGCIYMFTNKINKKIYIGKTINWKQRKRIHKRSAKKPTYAFAKALKKHGWENFKREVLIDDVPEEYLSNLEKYYIEVYNSIDPEIGYNMSQTKNHSVKGGGTISFNKNEKKWTVLGKNPEQKYVGQYFTKKRAKEALALYNTTGETMPSDLTQRKKGTGSICFVKKEKKWEVRSKKPERKSVGRYLTKERAVEALDLYNTTGKIMQSDIKIRKRGTGTISKVKSGRFRARFKGKYIGTFDTESEAEEALEKLWRD